MTASLKFVKCKINQDVLQYNGSANMIMHGVKMPKIFTK